MVMTSLERVALATCRSDALECQEECSEGLCWLFCEERAGVCEERVRAAVTALRDPDEAMLRIRRARGW